MRTDPRRRPVRPRFAVRAVAFDLDGTLLHTLPDIAVASDRMLRELGHPAAGEALVSGYIGNGIPRLVKRLLTGELRGEPATGDFERALEAFMRHYRATFLATPQPYPGVREGLEHLRAAGLQLACVTNKARAFTEPLLEATGLARFFPLVLSGDSLPSKKPDPGPLLHVARHFGIAPPQLLMVGDSDNDARAARAAGCPVVCVAYGYRGGMALRELGCDAIVDDLLVLQRLVDAAA